MVGGTLKNNLRIGIGLLQNHPKDLRGLLKALTRMVVGYALIQVQYGAHIVQIFDFVVMMIKDDNDDDGGKGDIFE